MSTQRMSRRTFLGQAVRGGALTEPRRSRMFENDGSHNGKPPGYHYFREGNSLADVTMRSRTPVCLGVVRA